MATRLTGDEVEFVSGYYASDVWPTMEDFIVRFVLTVGFATLRLHISAIFLGPQDEQDELHARIHALNFDREHGEDWIRQRLREWHEMVQNSEEEYQNFQGSGWTFIDVANYWLSIGPMQPNEPIRQVQERQMEQEERAINRQGRRDEPVRRHRNPRANPIINSFVKALCQAETNSVNRREWIRVMPEIREALGNNPQYCDAEKVWWQDVAKIEKEARFALRIFSHSGMLMKSNQKRELIPVNLYYKDGKWAWIRNLDDWIDRHKGHFCDECQHHHMGANCPDNPELRTKREELKPKEGQVDLITFADFESFIKPDGKHSIASWAYLTLDNDNNQVRKKIGHRDSYDTEADMLKDFVDGLFHYGKENTVFFHNFKGYDSHLLISHVVAQYENVSVRGKSLEKIDVLVVEKKGMRVKMMDSYNFLASSLAKLADNCSYWEIGWGATEPDRRKAAFPYDWFDGPDKFMVDHLPADDEWYNRLTQQQQDTTVARQVWEDRGMRVFRDFHDYYLRNDVVLLANIVTEFRKLIWTKFKTDICHFQGTPSLTYYLARFLPKMELATIPDRDLYLLFTKNIRGGVTQVMHRYFNMDDYPTGYAFYLDVNSLYPSCMIQELPGKYLGASNLPSRNPDHMNLVQINLRNSVTILANNTTSFRR